MRMLEWNVWTGANGGTSVVAIPKEVPRIGVRVY